MCGRHRPHPADEKPDCMHKIGNAGVGYGVHGLRSAGIGGFSRHGREG